MWTLLRVYKLKSVWSTNTTPTAVAMTTYPCPVPAGCVVLSSSQVHPVPRDPYPLGQGVLGVDLPVGDHLGGPSEVPRGLVGAFSP